MQAFAEWIDGERVWRAPTARAPGLLRDLAEGLVLWVGFQL